MPQENFCFHILSRGNQKQKVFLDPNDYEKYLGLLKHYKRKHDFQLYAWCLMPNHTHLILKAASRNNLAKIMQGLNLAYAKWFNDKYNKVGHLWQGRYKRLPIQNDQYAIVCINYIEMNPVRAKIVKSTADYPWSSYRSRIAGHNQTLLDVLCL